MGGRDLLYKFVGEGLSVVLAGPEVGLDTLSFERCRGHRSQRRNMAGRERTGVKSSSVQCCEEELHGIGRGEEDPAVARQLTEVRGDFCVDGFVG